MPSVVPIEIIPASTGQATSEPFSSAGPRTLCSSAPFGPGEGAKVQITHNGAVWQDLFLNGVLQEIFETHSVLTILGPGLFRVIKSTTVLSISVVTWKSEVDA